MIDILVSSSTNITNIFKDSQLIVCFVFLQGTKIKLYAIRARDDASSRIVPFFTIATAYIEKALETGGMYFFKVFVKGSQSLK